MAGSRLKEPLKEPVAAILEPAFKVGIACGTAGFVVGGTAGILKSSTPFLFASFSGLQWFILGSTFWGCRSTVMRTWTHERQDPSDLVKASTISGGITGGVVALLTRGRRNVLPGIFMCSLAGFTGQWAVNAYQLSRTKPDSGEAQPNQGFWKRMSDKSWSPMKIMSDEEYADMLRRKKLIVDAEIAVLEDKIIELRKQQQQEDMAQAEGPVSPLT